MEIINYAHVAKMQMVVKIWLSNSVIWDRWLYISSLGILICSMELVILFCTLVSWILTPQMLGIYCLQLIYIYISDFQLMSSFLIILKRSRFLVVFYPPIPTTECLYYIGWSFPRLQILEGGLWFLNFISKHPTIVWPSLAACESLLIWICFAENSDSKNWLLFG